MVSGFPEQTVVRQGSLVFCVSRSLEANPHSGREGEALTALPVEGATQAPAICSEAEHEQMESLERNERVCGECPTRILITMEYPGFTNRNIILH